MSNELTHLVFRAFDKPEELSQQGKPKGEFHAMFNPESFNLGQSFSFDDSQSDSETGSEQKFKSVEPQEFNFELLIDGTGASGVEKDVEAELEQFRAITSFEGSERRPTYLTVTWGTINLRGVLKKFDIRYTLFRNDGSPVRAILLLSLAEYKTPEQQLAENPDLASDLTRLVQSAGGNSLDLLAHQNYGNSDQLVALAQQNGLNSLREMVEGQRLELPSTSQLTKGLQSQAQNTIQQSLSNLF